MSDKMRGGIVADSTSLSIVFLLRKTADNTELTGKVASDMTGSYLRQGGLRVSISLSDLAAVNSAYSSGGVKEVDSTNMPGLYRLDVPDASIASGVDWTTFSIKVSGAYVWFEKYPLTTQAVDPLASAVPGDYSAGTAGHVIGTALPDLVAGAAGGLLISGSNAGTTTLGALTITGVTTHTGATVHTGNVSMAAGLTITQSTSNQPAVSITGNGTGDGIKTTGGTFGNGANFVSGGTSGSGIKSLGITAGASFSGFGNSPGISAAGAGTGPGMNILSGGTGNGMTIAAGSGGIGVSVDTLTISGAVTLSSTLTVSGATSLAAVALTTLTASGAVAFQSTFIVTGATTLTGAVTASNVSNNIVGCDIAKIDGSASAATDQKKAALVIVRGVVSAGGTTTSIPTSSLTPAAAVTDQFKARIVIFDADTTTVALRGQATDITASTAGGTLTVSALTTAPAAADTFGVY